MLNSSGFSVHRETLHSSVSETHTQQTALTVSRTVVPIVQALEQTLFLYLSGPAQPSA